MNEIWKNIKGLKGEYQISNTGKVKSVRYDKLLSIRLNERGYCVVSISKYRKVLKVHRLVAKAFIKNPENKPQVNHKDGDKSNNNDWNLEWMTNKENRLHAHKLGLYSKGKRFSIKKLTKLQSIFNCNSVSEFIKELSKLT